MSKNGNGITAEEAVKAVQGSKGFVTTIARRLNCSRMTVYRLRDKYSTVAQAIEDEREQMKDFAEGKLFQQIDAGNTTATIFYLKTQGKDRGYIERQEYSGPDGEAIIIKWNEPNDQDD